MIKKIVYTIIMMNVKFVNNIIRERFYMIGIVILLLFIIIFVKLSNVMTIKNNKYKELLYEKTSRVYVSKEGERGKIYDRNGKLLVGNTKIDTIVYSKNKETTQADELKIAKLISESIELNYDSQSDEELRTYYLLINKDKLIRRLSSSVIKKYEENKINNKEYTNYLKESITEEDIDDMTEEERKISLIYSLMNEGYKYAYKTIKSNDVTKEEMNFINQNKDKLTGFEVSYTYKRYYPYK